VEAIAESVFVEVGLVEDVLAGRPCWPGRRSRVVAALDALWREVDVPEPEEPSLGELPSLRNDEDYRHLPAYRLRQIEEAHDAYQRTRREYDDWRARRDAREAILRREAKLR
jgi:hypothetical protein